MPPSNKSKTGNAANVANKTGAAPVAATADNKKDAAATIPTTTEAPLPKEVLEARKALMERMGETGVRYYIDIINK
jgi:hypothetical protein